MHTELLLDPSSIVLVHVAETWEHRSKIMVG